jgi:hypothetical protein
MDNHWTRCSFWSSYLLCLPLTHWTRCSFSFIWIYLPVIDFPLVQERYLLAAFLYVHYQVCTLFLFLFQSFLFPPLNLKGFCCILGWWQRSFYNLVSSFQKLIRNFSSEELIAPALLAFFFLEIIHADPVCFVGHFCTFVLIEIFISFLFDGHVLAL